MGFALTFFSYHLALMNLEKDPDRISPHVVELLIFLLMSIFTCLIGALLTFWGKQWASRLAQREGGGSDVDRGRRQQAKMNQLTTWHFKFMMSLPTLLADAALLLLSCGLYKFAPHFSKKKALNDVISGFFATLLFVYVVSISVPVLLPDSPYHTPLSGIARLLVRVIKELLKYLW